MRTIIACLLLCSSLSFSSTVFAAGTPPGFEATKWNQLVALVAGKGEKADMPDGVWSTLKVLNPDNLEVAHKANYISAIVAITEDGRVIPTGIWEAFSDWQSQSGGGFKVDQLILKVQLSGEILNAYRATRIEDAQGHVVSHEVTEVDMTDGQVVEEAGTLLAFWYQYLDNKTSGL